MTTSLSAAELYLANHVTAHQAALDQAATAARAECISAMRQAIATAPEGTSDETRDLLLALAGHVSVGRAGDDYPELSMTPEAYSLIRRARAAGLLGADENSIVVGTVRFYSDCSGFASKGSAESAWSADYDAWDAARRYRAATAV